MGVSKISSYREDDDKS